MDIDKLITTAKNSYQTNKYRSYRECYNDGVMVLAELIRQQLLQQTPCSTPLSLLEQELSRVNAAMLQEENMAAYEKLYAREDDLRSAIKLIKELQPMA